MSTLEKRISIQEELLRSLTDYKEKVGFVSDNELSKSLQFIEEHHLPDTKNEEYKYCNVQALLKKNFSSFQAASYQAEKKEVEKLFLSDCLNLVLVNGNYVPELSDNVSEEKGLQVSSLQEMPDHFKQTHFSNYLRERTDFFEALTTAFSGRGICIYYKKNSVCSKPIHVIHWNGSDQNAALAHRNFIVVDENAQAELIESSYSLTGSSIFSSQLSEIKVANSASLNHYRLQDSGDHSYQVNNCFVYQDTRSFYANHSFIFSGELQRNNLEVSLNGEHAETKLNGLFVTNKNQLVDNHTVVDHRVPNCNSSELYKGILSGKSNGVFNGKIFVQKDAQKTNAYQSSKNMLLSDDASINTKPQLEIYADDVKCSHGTSTGMIDEDALFYLKARGIGDKAAKQLLLSAFGSELIESLPEFAFREKVKELFEASLNAI